MLFSNFNDLVKVYEFKSFKRNLKFKKYNIGITKFIKNRKKYITRKRFTSNLIWYNNISVWTKIFSVTRQYSRYNHFFNSLNYCAISTILGFLLIKNPKVLNLSGFNYSNISNNIIFNKSLFLNYNHFFLKNSFSNLSKSLFFFNRILVSDNFLLKLSIYRNYIHVRRNFTDNITISNLEFLMLINSVLSYVLNFILTFKKLFSFFFLKFI